MHKIEHRSILSESVPKVASTDLLDITIGSTDAGEENSRLRRVSMALTYAFSKAELLATSKTSTASRSLCEHEKFQK